MMAPGKGLEQIGGAIGQAGREIEETGRYFEEFAKQKKASDDFAADVEFRVARAKHGRALEADIKAEGDENKWTGIHGEGMGSFESSEDVQKILSRMSPEQREKTMAFHKLSTENELVNVQSKSFKKSESRKQAIVVTAAEELAQGGNSEASIAAIDEIFKKAVETNTMYPLPASEAAKAAKRKADAFQVRNMIGSDPWGAEEFIQQQIDDEKSENLPHSTADQLNSYLGQARTAQSLIRTEFYGMYRQAVVDIRKNQATPEQIDEVYALAEEDYKSGRITAGHLESIYNSLYPSSGTKKKGAIGYADLNIAANQYDESRDPDGKIGEALLDKISSANLEGKLEGFLIDKIIKKKGAIGYADLNIAANQYDESRDPDGKIAEALLDKISSANLEGKLEGFLIDKIIKPKEDDEVGDVRSMVDSQLDRMWTTGVFHEMAGVKKNEVDPKKQDKANRIYLEHQERLNNYFKTTSNPTLNDAMDFARNNPEFMELRKQKAQQVLTGMGEGASKEGGERIYRTHRALKLSEMFPDAEIMPYMSEKDVIKAITASRKGGITSEEGAEIKEYFKKFN
jgi:hypothetical protein